MTLWHWDELTKIANTSTKGPLISGASIDSRSIVPGDLFIALDGNASGRFNVDAPGARDGHDFVEMAGKAGAAAAMVSRPVEGAIAQLMVSDTLDGLRALGALGRERMQGRVVAVTGSSGKTTFKQWLYEVLSTRHATHAATGSLNNHWGVPLTLARMPVDAVFGVVEIGTNHPGEIGPLSELASPDVAVLLNVLPAHIGNFGDLSSLRAEKQQIVAGLRPGGVFVAPPGFGADISFGLDNGDVTASYQPMDKGWQVTAETPNGRYEYYLAAMGKHRLETSLAVLACLIALGQDPLLYLPAFGEITVPEGRGNVIAVEGVQIIDDSYNANVQSLIFALEDLSVRRGRRFALIGEMLELGAASQQLHQEVAEHFVDIDEVITFGEGFAACPGGEHVNAASEFDLETFAAGLRAGDVVLVKGANQVFWVSRFVRQLSDAISKKKPG